MNFDLIIFFVFETSPMAVASIKSRILQGIIEGIDGDPVTGELEATLERIRRMLHLPKMVPEAELDAHRITPQHFLQWDPRVFVSGPIWDSVSFPPGRAVTKSRVYLFIAVLFFVDNRMRAGEPRVWRELCHAWETTFRLAPGESGPNVSAGRYGSLFAPGLSFPDLPLEGAISGESDLLTPGEQHWLKDCLRYYAPLDSLEKVLEVRASMVTEGPRWWRSAHNGELVWIPKRYWGANGR
jgi:hypothetical protein